MAEFGYQKKTRGLFNTSSEEPFKLSRSKIDLFFECPRCFYLDRRFGIARPQFPAFTLNSAVDRLLKTEFDVFRSQKQPHPLMKERGIDAIPFTHKNLDAWRENFVGVQYHHAPTNFLVFGAVDDIWENPKGELHVVDYKATSKDAAPTIEGYWQRGYKRQMEVYQWLLRGNGFSVSPVGYFVYANGRKDANLFDNKLEFDLDIISYKGDDSWIEQILQDARACLMSETAPASGKECEYCPYREHAGKVLQEKYFAGKKSTLKKKEDEKQAPNKKLF